MADTKPALDAISKSIKNKEIINEDYDETSVLEEELNINESSISVLPTKLKVAINSKDVYFDCLCNLNLGKALRMVDGKLEKNPVSDKMSVDLINLDMIFNKIKNTPNAFVILSNIFTYIPSPQIDKLLPYKTQLSFIYKKIMQYGIKDKIVALVRGTNELKILNDKDGQDHLQKLANILGLSDRVLDTGATIKLDLTTDFAKKDREIVTFKYFNGKINTRTTAIKSMRKYAKENPGADIYYCTDSTINWSMCAVTTYTDKDGTTKQKPCYFICFGPMYEYDKTNERKSANPYTPNSMRYKVGIDEHNYVRADFETYNFPQKEKRDTTHYTASCIANEMLEKALQDMAKQADTILGTCISKIVDKDNKKIADAIITAKRKLEDTQEAQAQKEKQEQQEQSLEEVDENPMNDVREGGNW